MSVTNNSGQEVCPFDSVEVSRLHDGLGSGEMLFRYDTAPRLIEGTFSNNTASLSPNAIIEFDLFVYTAAPEQTVVPFTTDAMVQSIPESEDGDAPLSLSISTTDGTPASADVSQNAIFLELSEGDLVLSAFTPEAGLLEGTFEAMGTCRKGPTDKVPVMSSGAISIR